MHPNPSGQSFVPVQSWKLSQKPSPMSPQKHLCTLIFGKHAQFPLSFGLHALKPEHAG